jgi:hypothetical protein
LAYLLLWISLLRPRIPGQAGAEGVVLHPIAIEEDIVADEEHILEGVKGEARGVAIDRVGLDAVMDEVFFEGAIEGERAGDLVDRIVVVDAHLGRSSLYRLEAVR